MREERKGEGGDMRWGGGGREGGKEGERCVMPREVLARVLNAGTRTLLYWKIGFGA